MANQKKTTDMTPPKEPLADSKEMMAYEQYAGAGFEGQTQDDLTVPFLTVLQGLSKPVQENRTLRQGMIYNTVTGEAVEGEDGVLFVPACTQHLFVQWRARRAGGGFVAVHEPNSPIIIEAKSKSKEFGKFSTAYNEKSERVGDDLIETFYVYGLSLGKDGSDCVEATIAFTSTGIKCYKNWMTRARSIQLILDGNRRIPAPLFAHVYRLKTVDSKNAKGSWSSWTVGFDGEDAASSRLLPSDMRFQAALRMGKLLAEGRMRVAHESQHAGGSEDDGTDGAGHGPVTGDKPVF
jgi:hypothetical protein